MKDFIDSIINNYSLTGFLSIIIIIFIIILTIGKYWGHWNNFVNLFKRIFNLNYNKKELNEKGNILKNNNSISIKIDNQIQNSQHVTNIQKDYKESLDKLKKITKIMFIDDDNKFQAVKMLINAGWICTSSVKDLSNLDSQEVKDTQIFFVDINGVGKKLDFHDEGLGLALALIDKYPEKKIIIYSAETQGNRLHEALNKAHALLYKNAEPYQFIKYVEQFSTEIFKNGKI